MLEAPEDMLMMFPFLAASMAGRKARQVRYMDLTLRSKEKSQSCSEQSRMVPWWTKPAQLKRMSMGPSSAAREFTAWVSRTSNFLAWMLGNSAASFCSFDSLRSVAWTVAPSLAKARAVAAPMPWPAAVNRAFFPCSLPLTADLRPGGGCRNRSEDRPLQVLNIGLVTGRLFCSWTGRSWTGLLERDFVAVGEFARGLSWDAKV